MITNLKRLVALALAIQNIALISAQVDCSRGPADQSNPRECCQHTSTIDQAKYKTCYAQYGGATLLPNLRGLECLSECIMNATMFMVNGQINVQSAIQYYTASASPEWVPIVTAAIKNCSAEALKRQSDFNKLMTATPPTGSSKICNPISSFVLACVHMFNFRSCPASNWKASTKCNALREYMIACPLPSY